MLAQPRSLIDQNQGGFQALREAASLAPQNLKVKDALLKIHSSDSIHCLQKLCAKFVLENDKQAGKDALGYLARPGEIPTDIAEECLNLVLNAQSPPERDLQDRIFTGLLRKSGFARKALAKQLRNSPTCTFDRIYAIGDGSAESIAALVLDRFDWPNELTREAVQRDIFQLFLAKLMQVGSDLDERALRGISRLLAIEGDRVHDLLDEETFTAILSSLDYRLPKEVRSPATLATSKYLEAAGENGELILRNFISKRVARHTGEDLVIAFSATGAVFLMAPSIASGLFMTEGFVPSLVTLLEKRARSEQVKRAALDMLNAACIDTPCREVIAKNLAGWLRSVLETGKGQTPGVAAVILTKIQGLNDQNKYELPDSGQNGKNEVGSIVSIFKKMMCDQTETNKQNAIEGLAHASIQPMVKEELTADKDFFETFLATLRNSHSDPTTVYGGLSIIDNMTRYLPTLSEEQKRISQIKAYANAKKSASKPETLDEDAAVARRCTFVVDARITSTLVAISKTATSNSLGVIFNVLLSLSRNSSHRGIIAQQGGVKLLLQKYPSAAGNTKSEACSRRSAAHALARILISVDPALVFTSGSPPITSAIRPILSLLTEDPNHINEGPRDLLPKFEALLALTNLASTPLPEVAETIIRLSFAMIEDLLLGKNTMIQRASTELVCNLMTCSSGIELFADQSKAAARRMHVLLALADVDDKATRRAAGGALGSVTEFEGAAIEILGRERGVEILLGLCKEDDQDVVHRGVVCIYNLLSTDGVVGKRAKEQVKSLQGIETLKSTLQGFNNREMLELAVQALEILLE